MKTFGLGFTIKPVTKTRKHTAPKKQVKYMLYCIPIKQEDGSYLAKINTRGIDGYENITILPFTLKSFDIKGRKHLFKKEKLEGKYMVHLALTQNEVELNYYSPEIYTSIFENNIFKGHIVEIGGKKQFDMIDYVGHIKHSDHLLNRTYTSKELSE